MNDVTVSPGTVLHIGEEAGLALYRDKIIGLIQHVPNLLDVVRKFSPTGTFRVVMSGANAHLFHPAADGTYAPVLRLADGRIQEHAHLVKLGPDVLNVASNVILAAAMASIAHKLSAIDAKLDHVTNLLTMTQRGRMRGALANLAIARSMSLPHERRQASLTACQALVGELGATLGQLKAYVAVMPDEETGRFGGLFGSGFAKADKAFLAVQDEVQVVVHGMGTLLRGYSELEEPLAARTALGELARVAQEAGLQNAIRKARLLPAKPGQPPPEEAIVMLRDGMGSIGTNLVADGSTAGLAVSVDLHVRELSYV